MMDFTPYREAFLSTPSARRATSEQRPPCPHFNNFYPRPPRGGRHASPSASIPPSIFLSTPSARRATVPCCILVVFPLSISIHALREEGDNGRADVVPIRKLFLSTPSARRATQRHPRHLYRPRYFYPRPPRGGRHGDHRRDARIKTISIHALREEGDLTLILPISFFWIFLSTPSARRATAKTEKNISAFVSL